MEYEFTKVDLRSRRGIDRRTGARGVQWVARGDPQDLLGSGHRGEGDGQESPDPSRRVGDREGQVREGGGSVEDPRIMVTVTTFVPREYRQNDVPGFRQPAEPPGEVTL